MSNGTAMVYGLLAIYLLAAVINGNGELLVDKLKADGKEYAPWIIAVFGLTILSGNETTKPLVTPFALLLAANLVLRNYGTIQSQLSQILGGLTQ